jgi:hypothetical protein
MQSGFHDRKSAGLRAGLQILRRGFQRCPSAAGRHCSGMVYRKYDHHSRYPSGDTDQAAEQSELFADVLSVGLMYQTPYEKYDVYKEVHPDDKMAFKALVENLLKNIAHKVP